MNRTYPQNVDTDSLGSAKSHLTDKTAGATHDQPDCCRKCFSWTLCTRRCICVSAISLIILGIIIAIITLAVTVGIPPPTPGDLPNSLPGYLIFYCKNRRLWIYADKRCNGFNDCGDCSDEMGSQANCPPCGSQFWSCTLVVFYEYCTCIPRSLCRDGIQHCFDWSDEYLCTR
ncbi:hypothetical protein Chor_003626 [Crotalus horridus]